MAAVSVWVSHARTNSAAQSPAAPGGGAWTDWTPCSANTCGESGRKSRSRECSFRQGCQGRSRDSISCVKECLVDGVGEGTLELQLDGLPHGRSLVKVTKRFDTVAQTTEFGVVVENNLPPATGRCLQLLTGMLAPFFWTDAYEVDSASNGRTVTAGNFQRNTDVLFHNGQRLTIEHISRMPPTGRQFVSTLIRGQCPKLDNGKIISQAAYIEEYSQMNPDNGLIFASSPRIFALGDVDIPFFWNSSIKYTGGRSQRFIAQQMHVNGIKFVYNPDRQRIIYNATTSVSKSADPNRCYNGLQLSVDRAYCEDVDECGPDGRNRCSQMCQNTLSSFYCACRKGYRLQPNGMTCLDVDECEEGSAQCSLITQRCVNTRGSYQCVTKCPPGHKPIAGGRRCTDVNECEDKPTICQHRCINTVGNYRCVCHPGYQLAADMRNCIRNSIPSCASSDHGCQYKCIDTATGFRCGCPNGYKLDRDNKCVDVDECVEQSPCSTGEVCLNMKGNYRCQKVVCPSGYKFARRSRLCVRDCAGPTAAAPDCPANSTVSDIVQFILVNLPKNYPYVRIKVVDYKMQAAKNCLYTLLTKSSDTPFGIRNRDGKAEIYRERGFVARSGRLFDMKFRAQCYKTPNMNELVFQTTFNVYISVAPFGFDNRPTLQFIVPRSG